MLLGLFKKMLHLPLSMTRLLLGICLSIFIIVLIILPYLEKYVAKEINNVYSSMKDLKVLHKRVDLIEIEILRMKQEKNNEILRDF